MNGLAVFSRQQPFGAISPSVQGIGFMLVAAFLGTAMGAMIRHVSLGMHPFEIVFFRSLFGFLVLAPVFLRYGVTPLITTRLKGHMGRAAINAASMLLFFLGISMTPLAKASALNFTSPLFITILAVLFLGEKIRARRITALLIGFAGTWIILQPGVVEFDVGAGLVLGAAILGAVTMVLIKTLVRTDSSLTITLYTSLLSVPIALLFALPVWQTPSFEQLGWLAMIGAVGSGVHLCTAQAIRAADVTVVLPADFTKLIWAAAIGYIIFAEVPDAATWFGGTIIFASAGYIAWRERQLNLGGLRRRGPQLDDGFKSSMPPI